MPFNQRKNIEPVGVKWRVKTGTFTGMNAAQAGANKLKQLS